MEMIAHWIGRAVAFVSGACALGIVVAPAAAQTADKTRALVGTWLIEPAYYDPWVEDGVDVPWYPLVVLRAKRFGAYLGCPERDQQ